MPECLPGTHLVLFADDTTFSLKDGRTSDLLKKSEVFLELLKNWCNVNSLLLNEKKTHTMILSVKAVDPIVYPPVKFLGLWIDCQLNWKHQCERTSSRLSTTLHLIRRLHGVVSQEILIQVYFACFHSIMVYGVLAWGHAADASNVFGIQRKCVRILEGRGYREDCRDSFQRLGILTLPSVFILEVLLYVHKNEDTFQRRYGIHSVNTRGCRDLDGGFHRLQRTRTGTKYWGPRLFNKLPTEVRSLPFKRFKCVVKDFLKKNAFYSIDEFLGTSMQTMTE